jgi:hypothetical protein
MRSGGPEVTDHTGQPSALGLAARQAIPLRGPCSKANRFEFVQVVI